MKYTIQGNEILLGSELVASFKDGYEASYVANVLNQEFGKYEQIVKNRNDTIANLQDDLVNANVEIKMLQEQLAKLSIVEDIAENLLDPSDTRLADAEESLATKDDVILAQSERIKELEGVLKQIANNAPTDEALLKEARNIKYLVNKVLDFGHVRFLALRALGKTTESEADNG